MRDIIDLIENINVPLISFKQVFHIGTLKIADKQRNSYEGSGLSVSLHPEAWKQIAKGHVSGIVWTCSKEGNKFINAHKLTKKQKNFIKTWGIENKLVTVESVWRVNFYDDEAEENRFFEFATYEQAVEEADDIDDIEEVSGALHTTAIFNRRTLTNEKVANMDLLLTLWVEDTTDFDGVWWNDNLNISNLSAPRGVIVKNKVNSWNFVKNIEND